MRNIKCVVEYDGTGYSGWQRQSNTRMTIQEKIEDALEKLTRIPTATYAAGRTDAGVHALGQVFNFKTDSTIPAARFPFALNAHLPDDIVVKKAEEVEEDFHSRYAVRGKIYRYQLYNAPQPPAIGRHYFYFYSPPVDVEKMREGARYLEGRHDFAAFRSSGCGAKNTVKELYEIRIDQEGPKIYFTFDGSGFLYNMVRIMVGTLLQVGRGRITPKAVGDILLSRDRKQAGPTVPPEGLILLKVKY